MPGVREPGELQAARLRAPAVAAAAMARARRRTVERAEANIGSVFPGGTPRGVARGDERDRSAAATAEGRGAARVLSCPRDTRLQQPLPSSRRRAMPPPAPAKDAA